MLSHFDNLLLTTATDGASASIGLCPTSETSDVEFLMDAWFRERQGRIEASLFLDEARRLLRQILGDGELSASSRRKARQLLQALRSANLDRRVD